MQQQKIINRKEMLRWGVGMGGQPQTIYINYIHKHKLLMMMLDIYTHTH